jgi:hypothetical protein
MQLATVTSYDTSEEYFSPAIEVLIDKSFKGQWSLDTTIDWTQEVVVPPGLDRSVYVNMVSQLYYAEKFTIALIGRLLIELPDFQAKRFLAIQAADEARHARAYHAYLQRLGDIGPINPVIEETFDSALRWQGPIYGLIVAENCMLETEALHQQRRRIETLPCPLFRQLNEHIMRDEGRHSSFGMLYMKDKIAGLGLDDRRVILGWLLGLWESWKRANQNQLETVYTDEGSAVLRTDEATIGEHWTGQLKTLERIGLLPLE